MDQFRKAFQEGVPIGRSEFPGQAMRRAARLEKADTASAYREKVEGAMAGFEAAFAQLLDANGLPQPTPAKLAQLRAALAQLFDATDAPPSKVISGGALQKAFVSAAARAFGAVR